MLSIRRQCIIFMDKLCRLQATRKTKRKKTRPVILPKNEKQCKKRERDRSSYFWDPLLLFTLTKQECVNMQWSFHYCNNLSQKTVILDQKLFIGNYEAIKRVATSIDKPIFLHIWRIKAPHKCPPQKYGKWHVMALEAYWQKYCREYDSCDDEFFCLHPLSYISIPRWEIFWRLHFECYVKTMSKKKDPIFSATQTF